MASHVRTHNKQDIAIVAFAIATLRSANTSTNLIIIEEQYNRSIVVSVVIAICQSRAQKPSAC